MKAKYILALFLVFVSTHFLSAQNFEYGDTIYRVNYLEQVSPYFSCLVGSNTTGGLVYSGNVVATTLNYNEGLKVVSSAGSSTIESQGLAYYDLVSSGASYTCRQMRLHLFGNAEDSNYYHVNCSGKNTKVIIRAKASRATSMDIGLAYGTDSNYPSRNTFPYSARSSYEDGVRKKINLTSTITEYEIDFSDWIDGDKVNLFAFYIGESNVTVTIAEVTIVSSSAPSLSNRIKGNLYDDVNNDCSKQAGENGVESVLVEITDGNSTYYGATDADGNYNIAVGSGAATYSVRPVFNERNKGAQSNTCIPGRVVMTNGSGNELCCSDFAIKVKHCSQLSVEVFSTRRARCFRSNTIVSYQNYGNGIAASTVVKVVYPEFVVPVSSVPAWTSKVGDTLIYQLGTLGPGSYGFINLVDSVICGREEIRGLSQCMKVIISPKSQCVANEPAWDGSSVAITPYCESGVARFVVQNIGQDMTGSSAYRLYSNDTLVFQSTFQLIAGNTFQIRYPAKGAVIRMEADQRPAHPGRSQPRAFVEGCGTSAAQASVVTESLVLSVPQDDLDEEVAIFCMMILGSVDPNDKAAAPTGITDDHLVKAGTSLKYTIRFQNTGTDVAYKVVVVDTLDANLDVTSFTEGAASHPYVLRLTSDGGKTILNYIFNDINLKDSTTSEPESHGLITFYIRSKADLTDGNTVYNKAYIFFDYNSAVVTNSVNHTIGTYVPTDLSKGNSVQVITGLFDGNASASTQRVTVYPNPASDFIQVKLQQQILDAQLRILDLSGHEVYSGTLKGEITSVSLSGLSSGMYLYKVQSNGEFLGIGKLMVK